MSALLFIAGVLVMVVGIGASIALHELGHLLPAKRFGVKVPQYMIGFGPTLWSRRFGETEVGVKAIPLGGYVRMVGMFPPARGGDERMLRRSSTGRFSQLVDQARSESMEEVGPGDENRVFYKLSTPRKVAIMLGGPTVNLIIGVTLIAGVFMAYGVPTLTTRIATISSCVPSAAPTVSTPNPGCSPGDPAAPASAGLRPGDVIVAIDGTPVDRWDQVTAAVRDAAGRKVTFTVTRDGARQDIVVVPASLQRAVPDSRGHATTNPDGSLVLTTVGYAGIGPASEMVRQPITAVPGVVGEQLGAMAGVILRLPEKVAGVAQAAFGTAERDPEGPVSVVGVGRAGGEIAQAGFGTDAGATMALLLQLIAGLNLALFLFNLIPLPPLDGGHVVGALWEGVKRRWARLRGRPEPGYVDVAKALPLAYTVSMLLIGMAVLLIYADLVRPIKLF